MLVQGYGWSLCRRRPARAALPLVVYGVYLLLVPIVSLFRVSEGINLGFRGLSVQPPAPLFGQLGLVLLFPNTEVRET